MSKMHKEIYSDMICRIKCGSYQGKVIKAKPLLLLTIINLIENNMVNNNIFLFDKNAEEEYKLLFTAFGEKVTPFSNHFTIYNSMAFGISIGCRTRKLLVNLQQGL